MAWSASLTTPDTSLVDTPTDQIERVPESQRRQTSPCSSGSFQPPVPCLQAPHLAYDKLQCLDGVLPLHLLLRYQREVRSLNVPIKFT